MMLFVTHVNQDMFFMMIIFVMKYANFHVDNVKKVNQQTAQLVMVDMFSWMINVLLVMIVMILLTVQFALLIMLFWLIEDVILVSILFNIVQHVLIKILLNVHHAQMVFI